MKKKSKQRNNRREATRYQAVRDSWGNTCLGSHAKSFYIFGLFTIKNRISATTFKNLSVNFRSLRSKPFYEKRREEKKENRLTRRRRRIPESGNETDADAKRTENPGLPCLFPSFLISKRRDQKKKKRLVHDAIAQITVTNRPREI